jgi:type IV pilus assembly protein PilE
MKHRYVVIPPSGRPPATGFTLVELMVVVAIAAILVSIATAGYQSQVRKSRRTEARTALLDLAAREERWYSTNNAYTNAPANLGYATFTPVGSGYYNVAVATTAANPAAVPPTQAGYTITATATGLQVGDTGCRTFTVDQTGTQTALDSGGANTTATCWQ